MPPTALASNQDSFIEIPTGNSYIYFGDNVIQSVFTLAGDGTAGFNNGLGTTAKFSTITISDITTDASGNVYVADYGNFCYRKIDSSGNVTTFAGTAGTSETNPANVVGPIGSAKFWTPVGIVIDTSGNFYFSDTNNNSIFKYTISTGLVSRYAIITAPGLITIDSLGNLFEIQHGSTNQIRKINTSGTVTTLTGITNLTQAQGIATDSSNNVYVSNGTGGGSSYPSVIFKIDTSGNQTIYAGNGTGYTNGSRLTAQFNNPAGIKIDSYNDIYVVDKDNYRIRKIDNFGTVTSIAGDGTQGYVNGVATSARFNVPATIAVNVAGNNIYISDTYRIRQIINGEWNYQGSIKGPTGATGSIVLGNTLTVDAVNGNDSTASRGGQSYLTIGAAAAASQSGDTIWVLPGTYNLAAGITLTAGTSLTGISTQTVVIQMLGVTANTSLITMAANTRLENVTMKLTSAGHYTLTGLTFPGTTSTTAKLRTCVLTVDNSGASYTGTSAVTGVLFSGTGSLTASSFSFNSLKGSTINVYSNGGGSKRGVLVNNTNIASCRDMNVYVAQPATAGATGATGATGSYVGIETNDASGTGSIQLRATTIGTVTPTAGNSYTASDILQTTPTTITDPTYLASPGIQIGPGTDLVAKTAGLKPFSIWTYPTTIYYGLKGDIHTGSSGGYLWPGTMVAAGGGNGFPDTGTPQAYYRVQQPAIISGMSSGLNIAPGTGHTLTLLIRVTPLGGSITSTAMTVTFGATDTTANYYDSSYNVGTGDRIHVQVSYTGGNGNTAHDLTLQLDMF